MASRVVLPQQNRVEGNGEIKQKNAVEVQGRNRKALNDIGNLATIRDVEGKIQRPITRSFGAKLLANAQAVGDNNKIKKAAPGVAGKAVGVPKPAAKKAVVVKPKPVEVIEISPDTQEKNHENQKVVTNIEKSAAYKKKKKKVASMSSVLTARSKAACGLSKKPKEVVDIDASDVDDELAVVEYVEDIYIFYKLAENECRASDYMNSQPEINEKMRSILVDWLIEVHNRFDLLPETLYLTINLVDRFLSLRAVPKRELQLVGIGSMLIACKYEEILAPEGLHISSNFDQQPQEDEDVKLITSNTSNTVQNCISPSLQQQTRKHKRRGKVKLKSNLSRVSEHYYEEKRDALHDHQCV